ncbi:peptide alpha-N-acetyltransferase [Aureococcus anophagefferens]|nr:peptide alpha-N-acetyltransferase [Aureococcus anophagefferens]
MRVEDLEPIKALHEEWFPVRYSAAFYDAAVRERMVGTRAAAHDPTLYRRRGIAKELLRRCVLRAEAEAGCGAVYLHVITYNDAAIEFYERNDFSRLREIADYYRIDGASHACYVYALFLSRARAGDVRLDDDDGRGDVASYLAARRAPRACGLAPCIRPRRGGGAGRA